ncbi:MAG: hypothetical protein HC908_13800 [Calothrix sp. SM1_7_51]|nr:hypothetical protein [Calothrix sp. SM1_7_51]
MQDVVVASWSLLPPASIYTINELPNREQIISTQMKILESISSAIWLTLLENDKNREKLNSVFSKSLINRLTNVRENSTGMFS